MSKDNFDDLEKKVADSCKSMDNLKGTITDKVQTCVDAMARINKDFEDCGARTLLHLQQLRDKRQLYLDGIGEDAPSNIAALNKKIEEVERNLQAMARDRSTMISELNAIYNATQE